MRCRRQRAETAIARHADRGELLLAAGQRADLQQKIRPPRRSGRNRRNS